MMMRKRMVLIFLVAGGISGIYVAKGQGTRAPYTKKELVSKLILVNDGIIPELLTRQLTEKGNPYYGAIFDNDSIVSPIGTANLIETLMCAYVSPESGYYKSPEMLQRMVLGATALLNFQHEDGTIDLLSTNFHSTPDLGFTIYPVALAYSIMLQKKDMKYGEVPRLIKQYLLRAGKALSVGGIHTPNHRWVISGALAWLQKFFPNPAYKARVDQWLAEKIDIDADGQYHERSTAVYTPVTNRGLIIIAKNMKYDYLFEPVRRNLDLTFYFVHSNGEIATESSNRQDRYHRSNLAGYFFAYNCMALHDKDSRYWGMVRYIEETVPLEQLRYMLPYFLEDAALLEELPIATPLPTNYHKLFRYSDMARIREGAVDMSVIASNTTFFTFFKGEAALEAMRLSAAFFGKGQFESQHMEKEGDTYVLLSTRYGPYYQPLPREKIPAETDAWSKVPRAEREQSEVQKLDARVYITPVGGKAKIRVAVDGPENLPVTLELGFRQGGMLAGVSPIKRVENAYLAHNGAYATYQYGEDVIRIGPGAVAHKWTQLRGALPKLDADCIYFTGYAPCEFQFTVE